MYRPWKPEEAIGKVVREKCTKNLYVINICFKDTVVLGCDRYTYEGFFDKFVQLDGSICGVADNNSSKSCSVYKNWHEFNLDHSG